MKRLLLTALLALRLCGCVASAGAPTGVGSAGVSAAATPNGDSALAAAFRDHRSNVEVQGAGTVVRILADDASGSRHQRFVLRLASGQTILIAHDIDIAPRLAPLRLGDGVEFRGEYVYNAQGGLVHWTHHDPSGSHQAGWLRSGATIVQ